MLRQERHDYILQRLRKDKKVVSSELSAELDVSEDTIRRDLRELSDAGQILKVHGGALATSQHVFQYRKEEIIDFDLKNHIAQKAIPLIKQNSVIIMSGGTTNLELARMLPADLEATVYTYSLPIAMQLTEHPNIELIFIGGKMNKTAQVTIGMDVISAINDIRADYCFMGVSGLDLKAGLTEIDWEVAHIKKAMISISEKTILLSTASKLETVQRYLVETTENISTLITELDPEDRRIQAYAHKGIEVY
jgi:DeoR/GlpR family transcriptional regulator of sugar metabolism